DVDTAQKLVQRLSDVLVRAIERTVGIPQRMIVIPDALLAAVPMSVLQDQHGRPLLVTCEISIAPSAAAHVGMPHSYQRPRNALVIGDPAFTADAGPLERLPAAGDEARRISALY